jgi:integrase
LFLFIAPSGTKSWRLKYRFQGREKLLTLGTYPQLSLKEARESCADARKMLSGGIDPSAEKKVKARSAQITFGAVAREWLENQESVWTDGYAKDVLERIDKNVFPYLGTRPIGEITPPELLAVLRKVELRGAVEQAHRVRSICSLIFRYAIATGRAERDTAADLRGALKPRSKTPRAALTKPDDIGGLLRAIDDFQGTFVVKCGLQLLALTFLRSSEIRLGEWVEVDFAEKLWRIPAKRMKMRLDLLVPLSRQSLDILHSLHEATGDGRLMFPGLRATEKPISDATFIAALRRMGYTKEEMCAHGFRAMASTLLNEQGYPPDVIERQLAHTPRNKVRAAYNRAEYLLERRKMMDEWANYLDSLRERAKREAAA